jgi:hypothetical protein
VGIEDVLLQLFHVQALHSASDLFNAFLVFVNNRCGETSIVPGHLRVRRRDEPLSQVSIRSFRPFPLLYLPIPLTKLLCSYSSAYTESPFCWRGLGDALGEDIVGDFFVLRHGVCVRKSLEGGLWR